MFRVSTACVQRRYTLFCDARETYTRGLQQRFGLPLFAFYYGALPAIRPVRGSTEACVRVASFDVSEKSIYNRNSSRSLAARYAERIHTPARAHNGFVRSVFERKLTDGRSGLTTRAPRHDGRGA
jgi:hypothetical protein